VIDVVAEQPDRRAELLRQDGAEAAVVAISSPIGIEALPRDEALTLIAAHLDGVQQLGGSFAAWGPIPLDDPHPSDVDRVLARGCIGVSLPAGALTGPDPLDQLGAVLERIEQRGVPLFIHPGGPPRHATSEAGLEEPVWWRALTDYVSQMQAAWLGFVTRRRRDLPRLRIVFSMLAGLAPLQVERLTTRGGPSVELIDPLSFYDTSSYGPRAVETMARWVGPDQLVYGSDRPVLEPIRTGRERELMERAGHLIGSPGAPAEAHRPAAT
jgi:predicted TIM-barrel fold metal-dependent hydrolase